MVSQRQWPIDYDDDDDNDDNDYDDITYYDDDYDVVS